MYIDNYHTMKHDDNYRFIGDSDRKDELYMGFELEVDHFDDSDSYDDEDDYCDVVSKDIDNCTDHIFNLASSDDEGFPRFGEFVHYEEDGSLNNGFEIITQPASVSKHLEFCAPKAFYDQMVKTCRAYGFLSHDARTCGLHIHLDKKFFGSYLDSCTAKLMFLFERHWDDLKKFSRRREEGWCHRRGSSNRPVNYKAYIDEAKHGYPDRYFAVNISNDNTIEIRLWRGTLNLDTLRATLKFTARLAQLAKDKTTVELAKMSFKDILGDDPDIIAYARTRNLVD